MNIVTNPEKLIELDKLITHRNTLENKILEYQNKIEILYNLIYDKSNILAKLNKKIYEECHHEWDKGTCQKYSKPEYRCIKCKLIRN